MLPSPQPPKQVMTMSFTTMSSLSTTASKGQVPSPFSTLPVAFTGDNFFGFPELVGIYGLCLFYRRHCWGWLWLRAIRLFLLFLLFLRNVLRHGRAQAHQILERIVPKWRPETEKTDGKEHSNPMFVEAVPPVLSPAESVIPWKEIEPAFVEIGFDSFKVSGLRLDSVSRSEVDHGIESINRPFAIKSSRDPVSN